MHRSLSQGIGGETSSLLGAMNARDEKYQMLSAATEQLSSSKADGFSGGVLSMSHENATLHASAKEGIELTDEDLFSAFTNDAEYEYAVDEHEKPVAASPVEQRDYGTHCGLINTNMDVEVVDKPFISDMSRTVQKERHAPSFLHDRLSEQVLQSGKPQPPLEKAIFVHGYSETAFNAPSLVYSDEKEHWSSDDIWSNKQENPYLGQGSADFDIRISIDGFRQNTDNIDNIDTKIVYVKDEFLPNPVLLVASNLRRLAQASAASIARPVKEKTAGPDEDGEISDAEFPKNPNSLDAASVPTKSALRHATQPPQKSQEKSSVPRVAVTQAATLQEAIPREAAQQVALPQVTLAVPQAVEITAITENEAAEYGNTDDEGSEYETGDDQQTSSSTVKAKKWTWANRRAPQVAKPAPPIQAFYRDQQAYTRNPEGFRKAFDKMAACKWNSTKKPIGEKNEKGKGDWKAIVIAVHINPYRKVTQPYTTLPVLKGHGSKIAFYDTRPQSEKDEIRMFITDRVETWLSRYNAGLWAEIQHCKQSPTVSSIGGSGGPNLGLGVLNAQLAGGSQSAATTRQNDGAVTGSNARSITPQGGSTLQSSGTSSMRGTGKGRRGARHTMSGPQAMSGQAQQKKAESPPAVGGNAGMGFHGNIGTMRPGPAAPRLSLPRSTLDYNEEFDPPNMHQVGFEYHPCREVTSNAAGQAFSQQHHGVQHQRPHATNTYYQNSMQTTQQTYLSELGNQPASGFGALAGPYYVPQPQMNVQEPMGHWRYQNSMNQLLWDSGNGARYLPAETQYEYPDPEEANDFIYRQANQFAPSMGLDQIMNDFADNEIGMREHLSSLRNRKRKFSREEAEDEDWNEVDLRAMKHRRH